MNKWNDKDIPLKRITWKGVVEGPFFSYHCSHHYRNDSDNVIEIRYKFPLPYGKSVLTGFTATLNGWDVLK